MATRAGWTSPARARVLLLLGLAALTAAMVSHTVNGTWPYDIWTQLAPVREFAAFGLDAQHSLVAVDDPDPLLNPYTLVWGFVAGAFDLDGLTALRIAAVVNFAVVVAGFLALGRRVSTQRYAGPLLLVLTLFAWGIAPWRWAGFFNLNSMGSVLPLGSAMATGLALFGLAAVLDWLRGGGRRRLLLAATLLPLAFLIHPMTGTWALLLGAGFALAVGALQRRSLLLLGAIAVGGLVLLAWPYYPVSGLLGGAESYDTPNRKMFDKVVMRTFLALPGLYIVGRRLWQRRRDPVAFGTVLVLAVFLASWALGMASMGRVLPGAVLGAHLAIVQELPGWLAAGDGRTARRRRLVAAVALLVGVASTATGLARAVPRALLPGSLGDDERLASITEPFEPLPAGIGRHDVILASRTIALAASASSGRSLGYPGDDHPFIDDIERRIALERELRLLLPDPVRALPRLAEEGVEWLVLTPRDAAPWRDAAGVDTVVGTDDLVVLRLPPPH